MGGGAGKDAKATAEVGPSLQESVIKRIDGESGTSSPVALTGRARLEASFRRWDVDSTGTISMHELMQILKDCGVPLEAKDLEALFHSMDVNQDGVIDYQEFLGWLYPSVTSTTSPQRADAVAVPSQSSTAPIHETPDDQPALLEAQLMPLLVRLHSATQLPSRTSSSEYDASAIAFVRKDVDSQKPKVLGHKAKWGSCKSCSHPCWNATRDLGCHTLGPGADPSLSLHIEIWGNRELLGHVHLRLADIDKLDVWRDCPLALTAAHAKKSAGKIAPSLRFMIMTQPILAKKVFLVRHGESVWNKAQHDHKVSAMLDQVDHPLSEDGFRQCLQLQQTIAEALMAQFEADSKFSPNEAQFLNAQTVLSSPLSRAIQTALVGIHPILRSLKCLQLCSNVREKHNMGGFDTTGTAKGEAEIVMRLDKALKGSCIPEADRTKYLAVPLNSAEAEHHWWNDSRESASAVKERLTEFLSQLHFSHEERIIVVGHSHFFRALLQQGLNCSAKLLSREGIPAPSRTELLSKKLQNCGVMAIELDFSKGADRPIAEVELLFGTKLC